MSYSQDRPSGGAWAAAVLWACIPLFTCGLATPFSIGFAAYWLRSRLLIIAAAVYGACVSAFLIVTMSYDDLDNAPDVLFAPIAVGLMLSWVGGLIHSGILVPRMVQTPRLRQTPYLHEHHTSPSRRGAHSGHGPYPGQPGYPAPGGNVPRREAATGFPSSSTGYPDPTAGGYPRYPGATGRPQHGHPQASGPPQAYPPQSPGTSHAQHSPGASHTQQSPGASRVQPGHGRPPGPSQPGLSHTHPQPGSEAPYGRPPSSDARPQGGRRPGDPEWIGHYRVQRLLGRGGQGVVYLATSPTGTPVAVKTLHDLGDDQARDRFVREVETARRVATFSTAKVLDVSITGDLAYIVSEYVDGPSLEQLVRTKGPRDEDGLTRLALSTAGALAAIHKAGIVHRDFKPSNVLIGADGPRVIDFGIARALDHSTMTGKMSGTPPYMSPEQLSGTHVGPPSDVFSWGVTMVFAATGRPAFGEDTVPAVFNRVLNHHPDLTPLPQSLRAIVGSCLSKSFEDRPTASEVMLAIVH